MSPPIRAHESSAGGSFFLRAGLLVYQLTLLLVGPLFLLGRFFRGKASPHVKQRLGIYSGEIRRSLGQFDRPIWIHLVSVGEVLAAQTLIQELRRRVPEKNWVITTVTPTGQEVAQRLIRGPQDQLLYLPWDLGFFVRRCLRSIRPSLFLVFETEMWPTLFRGLALQGVPIVIVNGRISPTAYRRYLLARPFMERILDQVSLILAQSPQDARRFAAIGAPQDRIAVTGNVKWDVNPEAGSNGHEPAQLRQALQLDPGNILWTAGSTHPGEERLILQIYGRLKARYPALRLLIAPRHPERIPSIEQEILRVGSRALRRTAIGKEPIQGDHVFLLDTLGELNRFYQVSDLVFVGGSLVPHGGHNLVEPALFSKPILTGPHLANFHTMAESLAQAGGLAIVQSAEELEKSLSSLIVNPAARAELGARAHRAIRQHQGATARTVELVLLKWLGTERSVPK